MILRLCLLILLISQLTHAVNYAIDLERCEEEMVCFVAPSCLEEPGTLKGLVKATGKKLKTGSECDLVLQTKAIIDKEKMFVMMRVKAEKVKPAEGIQLNQGTGAEAHQFHCKPDGIGGNALFTFEKLDSRFGEQEMFCAFTVTMIDKTKDIKDTNAKLNVNPSLVYVDGTGSSVAAEYYNKPKTAIWMDMNPHANCDYTRLSSTSKDGPPGILLSELDVFREKLVCASKFSVIPAGSQPVDADSVHCQGSGDWEYSAAGATNTITTSFEVYCKDLVCRQCSSLPRPSLSCDGCTAPIYSVTNDGFSCDALVCPDQKWTLTGKEIIHEQFAACRKKPTKGLEFAWYLNDTEITAAACLQSIACPKNQTLLCTEPCTVTGWDSDEDLSCEQPDQVLEFAPGQTSSNLTCDTDVGVYKNDDGIEVTLGQSVRCIDKAVPEKKEEKVATGGMSAGAYVGIVIGLLLVVGIIVGVVVMRRKKAKKNKDKAEPSSGDGDEKTSTTKTKTRKDSGKDRDKKANKSVKSTISLVDSEQSKEDPTGSAEPKQTTKRRGKKSSRKAGSRRKTSMKHPFSFDNYHTWTSEEFTNVILPNFANADLKKKVAWLREHFTLFSAYSSSKKTPESGTILQYWQIVGHCIEDKCEDAPVWEALYRVYFALNFALKDKSEEELRLRIMKPFESYMTDYLAECSYYKRKEEPEHVTDMRLLCLEVLLHMRVDDVHETMRKMTFNEKIEVPLRQMVAACFTRERDTTPALVHAQFKRACENPKDIDDPNQGSIWGSYLQHCIYGVAASLITEAVSHQPLLFNTLYQPTAIANPGEKRKFTPSDLLFAYRGALIHVNSARLALDAFKTYNKDIAAFYKASIAELPTEEQRTYLRIAYQAAIKEWTLRLSELLVGDDEFDSFKDNLRIVTKFLEDETAPGKKQVNPINEDKIRERAGNLHRMIRGKNFEKECMSAIRGINH